MMRRRRRRRMGQWKKWKKSGEEKFSAHVTPSIAFGNHKNDGEETTKEKKIEETDVRKKEERRKKSDDVKLDVKQPYNRSWKQ